jgi:hypothetical protein
MRRKRFVLLRLFTATSAHASNLHGLDVCLHGLNLTIAQSGAISTVEPISMKEHKHCSFIPRSYTTSHRHLPPTHSLFIASSWPAQAPVRGALWLMTNGYLHTHKPWSNLPSICQIRPLWLDAEPP